MASLNVEVDRVGKPHMISKPLLKDLMKDLDSIVNWQILMVYMGVEKYEVTKVEVNNPTGVDNQKLEAFDMWLKQNPSACWKNVIDALFEMQENTLARALTRKYEWNDPRVSVTRSLVCHPGARIKVDIIGEVPCRKYLPHLQPTQEYFTLQTVSPPRYRSEREEAQKMVRLIDGTRPHNLTDFLKKIELSENKKDFKVGIEARFGKVYWKLPDDAQATIRPQNHGALLQSKVLKKSTFNPEVEEKDLRSLFEGRECISEHPIARATVKFSVQGQDKGNYRAVISEQSDGTFSLDAVYRESAIDNKTKLNIVFPGRKYDIRIGDCCESISTEHPKSRPSQYAEEISASMHRPSEKGLSLILCGNTKESAWKVEYIRLRKQRQYHWKPERKWVLARYDVDVFDCKANQTLHVDYNSPLLNQHVDIPKFDYSRIEIELWGRKIFPARVSYTRPSREKYYHFQSTEEMRLPKEKPIVGYDWTAEDLMSDFKEFLRDAFTIANILDSSSHS